MRRAGRLARIDQPRIAGGDLVGARTRAAFGAGSGEQVAALADGRSTIISGHVWKFRCWACARRDAATSVESLVR